jgi:hypothetical protein
MVTGTVDSKFRDDESKFELPEGSRYASEEDIIADWKSSNSKSYAWSMSLPLRSPRDPNSSTTICLNRVAFMTKH